MKETVGESPLAKAPPVPEPPVTAVMVITFWGSTAAVVIGCVCASRVARLSPVSAWQPVHWASVRFACIVEPFCWYGRVQLMSSWQEPQARRIGAVNARSPCAGARSGPAPSGSPWQTAHWVMPLRRLSFAVAWVGVVWPATVVFRSAE